MAAVPNPLVIDIEMNVLGTKLAAVAPTGATVILELKEPMPGASLQHLVEELLSITEKSGVHFVLLEEGIQVAQILHAEDSPLWPQANADDDVAR